MNKKKINQKMLISLFIVFIMVISTFGFILSYQTSSGQKKEYNGHKLTLTDQGTIAKLNGKTIFFNYFPTQLEDLNMSDSVKDELKNAKMLTVTYDPNSDWAQTMAEIQYQAEESIPEYTDVFIAKGLTNAENYTVSEITCKNSTSSAPVLELKEGDTTEITSQNSCIILSAKAENDFYRLYERMLYVMLGIME